MSPKNILIFSVILLFSNVYDIYAEDIKLGPLFYKTTISDDSFEYGFLGPFYIQTQTPDRSEVGFRPLFYKVNDSKNDISEFDFLYPISSYKRRGNSSLTQIFLHLIRFESEKLQSGFTNKELDIFPFIFYRNYENKDQDHFALFPFYGDLKNKFSKEKIKFFLFPFYLHSQNNGEITNSIIWPFLSFYSGEHKGFRIWPLWGKRTREKDNLDQRFALWPFYVKSEKVFYGEKVYSRSFLPFYSESKFLDVEHRSYFWPFINNVVNEKTGLKRWDAPWPFINFTDGPEKQRRIFPFYSLNTENENDRDGFILWPLYKYSVKDLEDHTLDKKTFLLFLYKDTKKIPLVDNGQSGRRIDLWPLFTYEKDYYGESKFHIFTIFEPFIRSNDRLYRNYSSFWRIFVWEKTADNKSYSSLLWNLFSSYKDSSSRVIEIRPILPLFSYSKVEKEVAFSFLGGLIGYSENKYFKLFYLPIDLNKDEIYE